MQIFGYSIFDFSKEVGYADAFVTIAVVCGISFCLFLVAKYKAPKG